MGYELVEAPGILWFRLLYAIVSIICSVYFFTKLLLSIAKQNAFYQAAALQQTLSKNDTQLELEEEDANGDYVKATAHDEPVQTPSPNDELKADYRELNPQQKNTIYAHVGVLVLLNYLLLVYLPGSVLLSFIAISLVSAILLNTYLHDEIRRHRYDRILLLIAIFFIIAGSLTLFVYCVYALAEGGIYSGPARIVGYDTTDFENKDGETVRAKLQVAWGADWGCPDSGKNCVADVSGALCDIKYDTEYEDAVYAYEFDDDYWRRSRRRRRHLKKAANKTASTSTTTTSTSTSKKKATATSKPAATTNSTDVDAEIAAVKEEAKEEEAAYKEKVDEQEKEDETEYKDELVDEAEEAVEEYEDAVDEEATEVVEDYETQLDEAYTEAENEDADKNTELEKENEELEEKVEEEEEEVEELEDEIEEMYEYEDDAYEDDYWNNADWDSVWGDYECEDLFGEDLDGKTFDPKVAPGADEWPTVNVYGSCNSCSAYIADYYSSEHFLSIKVFEIQSFVYLGMGFWLLIVAGCCGLRERLRENEKEVVLLSSEGGVAA